jgi:hypothetical protein
MKARIGAFSILCFYSIQTVQLVFMISRIKLALTEEIVINRKIREI